MTSEKTQHRYGCSYWLTTNNKAKSQLTQLIIILHRYSLSFKLVISLKEVLAIDKTSIKVPNRRNFNQL